MNSGYEKQVAELSKLWHGMLIASDYKNIEQKFSRIQGLSTTEIAVLSLVAQNEEIILKEIVMKLDIPKSTLTNIINRLEKREFINRVISNRDRRSCGLKLTEEGNLAQKEHIEFEKTVYGKIIMALNNEEREELLELMRKIVQGMQKQL